MRCVNALATEAMLVQQAADAEMGRPYPGRRQFDEIEAEAASSFGSGSLKRMPLRMTPTRRWTLPRGSGPRRMAASWRSWGRPTEPAAIAAFQRLAHTLVAWWDADDDRQQDRHERRRERNHETESRFAISSRTSCSGPRPQRQPRSSSPS